MESAGRLLLLGKGQLCFIVPDVWFLVWREMCTFCAAFASSAVSLTRCPLGKPASGGDYCCDALQLVTRNPVGELCSYLSVSGKIKDATSFQAI